MSQGQNVTVDVLIGSKCHCGRSELGRFVQASNTTGQKIFIFYQHLRYTGRPNMLIIFKDYDFEKSLQQDQASFEKVTYPLAGCHKHGNRLGLIS